MSRFRFPCPRLRTALGFARGCVKLSCFQTQKCSRWPFTESNCWTMLNSWMNRWSMKPIKTSSLIMLKFHHSHCKAGVGTRSANSGSVFSRNWCSGSGRPFYVNRFTGNANNIYSKANCSVLDVSWHRERIGCEAFMSRFRRNVWRWKTKTSSPFHFYFPSPSYGRWWVAMGR